MQQLSSMFLHVKPMYGMQHVEHNSPKFGNGVIVRSGTLGACMQRPTQLWDYGSMHAEAYATAAFTADTVVMWIHRPSQSLLQDLASWAQGLRCGWPHEVLLLYDRCIWETIHLFIRETIQSCRRRLLIPLGFPHLVAGTFLTL
jgi:hypothetical protein